MDQRLIVYWLFVGDPEEKNEEVIDQVTCTLKDSPYVNHTGSVPASLVIKKGFTVGANKECAEKAEVDRGSRMY